MSCLAIIGLVFFSVVFSLRFAILFLRIGVNLGKQQVRKEYIEEPDWTRRLSGQQPGEI